MVLSVRRVLRLAVASALLFTASTAAAPYRALTAPAARDAFAKPPAAIGIPFFKARAPPAAKGARTALSRRTFLKPRRRRSRSFKSRKA